MAKANKTVSLPGMEMRVKMDGKIVFILDLNEINRILGAMAKMESGIVFSKNDITYQVLSTGVDKVADGDVFHVKVSDSQGNLIQLQENIQAKNVDTDRRLQVFELEKEDFPVGSVYCEVTMASKEGTELFVGKSRNFQVIDLATSPLPVTMKPFTPPDTSEEDFWAPILTSNIDFNQFQLALDNVLHSLNLDVPQAASFTRSAHLGSNGNAAQNRLPFLNADEYAVIKFTAATYMRDTLQLPITPNLTGDQNVLPYYSNLNETISEILSDYVPRRFDAFGNFVDNPQPPSQLGTDRVNVILPIELIWSYWMEQAMLVQTMNAISLRFQNVKGAHDNDPLARFDTSPLRLVSQLLWSFISDEQHRTTLYRRVHEYCHAYDLKLIGKAIPQTPMVDNRSQFIAAFHNLLHQATIFFKDADDMTRRPDGFPVLTALREVHLLLAAGNHNAYFNTAFNARAEMLVMQYILARQEMRLFLGGRPMVPYPEGWMDRVDTMKSIQGWDSTSVLHYYDLASNGEKLLLAIRYGDWTESSFSSDSASNWAFAFRDHVQKYVNAYRVVTGVNLSSSETHQRNVEQRAVQPATLIQKRLAAAKQPAALRLRSNARMVLRNS